MKNKTIRMILGISLNLILVILGVFIIFSSGSKAYSFGMNIFNEQAVDTTGNGREVEVVITDGISAKALAKILYEKGLVADATICQFQIQLSEYNGEFIGGTYTLSTEMTPTEMMEALCDADEETSDE